MRIRTLTELCKTKQKLALESVKPLNIKEHEPPRELFEGISEIIEMRSHLTNYILHFPPYEFLLKLLEGMKYEQQPLIKYFLQSREKIEMLQNLPYLVQFYKAALAEFNCVYTPTQGNQTPLMTAFGANEKLDCNKLKEICPKLMIIKPGLPPLTDQVKFSEFFPSDGNQDVLHQVIVEISQYQNDLLEVIKKNTKGEDIMRLKPHDICHLSHSNNTKLLLVS